MIRPAFGVKCIIADVMAFAVILKASAPHKGGESDDEQIEPAEHTGLCAVAKLVAESDGIVLMSRAEENIFAQRDASVRRVEIVMIAAMFRFGIYLNAKSQQHLRETPDP